MAAVIIGAPSPSTTLASHAPERRLIAGRGTDESAWLAWPRLADLPVIDSAAWPAAYRRIWIIAPHPDDEVLGLGGTLARLGAAHADVRIVSVTDGEASHPGSPTWTPQRLADVRHIELEHALATLGAEVSIHRLGLPDGRVGAHRDALLAALTDLVDERDLILATTSFDGHPDHEACGDVAHLVGEITGAMVFEYPVWMWHWATPGETMVPWDRAVRLPLDVESQRKKHEAIAAFTSQLTTNGTHPPILPPYVLPRFERQFEVVFA